MTILFLLTLCGVLSVLLVLRSIVMIEAGYWNWGVTCAGF
jgi:hypothetical protein